MKIVKTTMKLKLKRINNTQIYMEILTRKTTKREVKSTIKIQVLQKVIQTKKKKKLKNSFCLNFKYNNIRKIIFMLLYKSRLWAWGSSPLYYISS